MTRIDSLGYPITIDHDTARAVAKFLRERGSGRTIVLCDRNVAARANAIAKTIGKNTTVLAFALGERRKTLRTVERVYAELAAAGADRTTTLVCVGGGVAGDLFGFVAATYMRGVPFVNVATSLVAMVDASIGGKTGVDLPAGKNLAGAFRDPLAVFCDIDSLETRATRSSQASKCSRRIRCASGPGKQSSQIHYASKRWSSATTNSKRGHVRSSISATRSVTRSKK